MAIVGAGRLASFLAPALREAGYRITEIVARARPQSIPHARRLATKVGAQAVTMQNATLDAALVWFCVPDREIRPAADELAARLRHTSGRRGRTSNRRFKERHQGGASPSTLQFAFHSSGAMLSDELGALRAARLAIASAHPLMTFVGGPPPSLKGVPFALEGDAAATKLARSIVRDLGAESFALAARDDISAAQARAKRARRKEAYHAWATMTSPLLVAYLVTMEEAARQAGLSPRQVRRTSLPIILQTLSNYRTSGAAKSFSGPLIRGDADTVKKHLAVLKKNPTIRAVYRALAQAALTYLPIQNRKQLERLLDRA